ncbi:MAG: L,D-transpeptidase, partial [Lachnospiraceae bacterium]|nr:L,D-transpeptidase [Lachnospiraceae bacterium]
MATREKLNDQTIHEKTEAKESTADVTEKATNDSVNESAKKRRLKKKIKNAIVTLIEIAVVSLIIIGVLKAIQSTLKGDSPISFIVGKDNQTQTVPEEFKKEKKGTGNYYIEVNIKKSALIVYEYDKKKENKEPVKVFPVSIGKSVKKGKFKISDKYGWMSSSNNNWNKYSSYFTNKNCIQSVNFREKYSWTMYESSYKALGKEKVEGANIKLAVNHAKWIYNNCGLGTEVNIKKGKKDDKLPL